MWWYRKRRLLLVSFWSKQGEAGSSGQQLWKNTMAEDDIYTKDGTVDIHRKPANKKKTGNWKACHFILGNECCERLAYYGMSTDLVYYLQERLNQGNVTASNNVTNWSGTCSITPLIGVFLADAYLGRY